MKTMMLAAAAVMTLGMGAAFADSGDGPAVNTQFTAIPGVVAQAPAPASSALASNQSGTTVYSTSQRSVATFPWNQNEGVGG